MSTETTEITDSPEPQVAEIDVVIDLAPSALELIKQNKDKYLSMTIAGIDDTSGAKLVDMARKVVKRARVKVGKRLTEINAPLKEKMAANKEMADSITGELKQIEDNLEAKYDQWESEVEAEAERIRIETEAKIKARKSRLADLDTFFEPVSETMQQYGKQVCTWENVRYSDDEEFEAMLVPIQAAFDAEQARIRAEIEKKKLAGERLVELTKYGVILAFGSDVLTQYGVEVADKSFLSEASAEKFDIMLDAVRSTYDHHQERLRRQAEEKAAAEQARKDAEIEAERIRKENDDLKAELARIKAEKEAQQQPVIDPVEEKPEPVAETLPVSEQATGLIQTDTEVAAVSAVLVSGPAEESAAIPAIGNTDSIQDPAPEAAATVQTETPAQPEPVIEAACLIQVRDAELKEILSLLAENGYTAWQYQIDDDDDDDDDDLDDDLDPDNYVEEGEVRIRLTGSIRDNEMEDVLIDAYKKHDYKLAGYLRQLSEISNPTIQ